ncbi:MAG: undecaprenyl-diphosphate phosphatase [Candidatus Nomurabacteria bacterium]|jgi:undecaprenyl-diphosphatase|nr:undecaprenyl-diphosphate phosphatase [Candidatus Nomurabacteria bacterium]
MNIETVTLGIVQGLTEFIPVSSSGHLVLVTELFGAQANHLFIQTLDIGTFLALVIFFRARILHILREIFIERNFRFARNIILTALPVGAIGFLLGDIIESSTVLVAPLTVATMLAIIGIVMIFLEKLPKLSRRADGEKLSWQRALAIGGLQVISLIPGSSRSGTTIIGGRLAGLNARAAAEYSFLVSIPIMAGLVLKLLVKDSSFMVLDWQNVLVGNIFAFLSGIIAINFLLDFLSKHDLKAFGIYRVVLSVAIIVLISVGVLQ